MGTAKLYAMMNADELVEDKGSAVGGYRELCRPSVHDRGEARHESNLKTIIRSDGL